MSRHSGPRVKVMRALGVDSREALPEPESILFPIEIQLVIEFYAQHA